MMAVMETHAKRTHTHMRARTHTRTQHVQPGYEATVPCTCKQYFVCAVPRLKRRSLSIHSLIPPSLVPCGGYVLSWSRILLPFDNVMYMVVIWNGTYYVLEIGGRREGVRCDNRGILCMLEVLGWQPWDKGTAVQRYNGTMVQRYSSTTVQ